MMIFHDKSKKMLLLLMCSFIVLIIGGCKMRDDNQDPYNGYARYTIIDRLSRQNDVYYQAADLLDVYIYSDDRDYAKAKFESFRDGVNCFVRDEFTGWQEWICPESGDNAEELNGLMQLTAWESFSSLNLSEMTDDELEDLTEILYQLADECDCNRTNSLASCFKMQNLDDATYKAATGRVQELLSTVKMIIE